MGNRWDMESFISLYMVMPEKTFMRKNFVFGLCFPPRTEKTPTEVSKILNNAEDKGYITVKKEEGRNIQYYVSGDIIRTVEKEDSEVFTHIDYISPSVFPGDRLTDCIDSWYPGYVVSFADITQNNRELTSKVLKLIKDALTDEEINIGHKVSRRDIKIMETGENGYVYARVKSSRERDREYYRYNILIDAAAGKILHDCDNYINVRSGKKKFCKHFYRVFMELAKTNPDVCLKILKKLSEGRSDWEFGIYKDK